MQELIKQIEYWISWLGPNEYLQAGFIVLVFIIIGKIGELIICRIAVKLAVRTKTDIDDKIIQILHRPLFITFILVGLALATLKLELQPTTSFVTIAALKTLGIWIWLKFIIQFTILFLEFFSIQPDKFGFIQSRTLPLLKNLAKVVFIGGALYFVMLSWRINITAWLASAGIIGIALGFAAKDTLANLFAGVFIMVDAPYKIGDFIILDSGERGQITNIGIRSTRMLTRDDIEITIPNSIMGTTKVTNESGGPHPKERIRIKVSVAYGSDIDKVRDVLMQIAYNHPKICKIPEPRVRFRSFGDSGLNIELLGWVDEPVLRGRTLDALNTEVYKKFHEENIVIPFPQRDIYIKEHIGR
jgi:small-conductance mechanosensitive channel